MSTFPRNRLAVGLAAALSTLCATSSFAGQAKLINIGAQPLNKSLNQLASEFNVILSYAPELVQGRQSKAIKGNLTEEKALETLLEGTPIQVKKEQNVYYLVPIKSNTADTAHALDDVAVVAYEQIEVRGNRLTETTGSTGLTLTVKQTPQAMSLIDAGMIKDFQIEDVGRALDLTTGIYRQEGDDASVATYYSRGFTVNSYMTEGMPSAGAVHQQNKLDAAIYESMEIVRGATGIMQGAGEASASVNLMRKRPEDYFTLDAGVTLGSWENRRVEVDVSVPLTEEGDISSRFVTAFQEKDTFVDNEHRETSLFYGIVQKELDMGFVSLSLHREEQDHAVPYSGIPHSFSDSSKTNLDRGTNLAATWSKADSVYESVYLDFEHQLGDLWRLKGALAHSKGETDSLASQAIGFVDSGTGLGLIGAAANWYTDARINNIDLRATGDFTHWSLPTQVVVGLSNSSFRQLRKEKFNGPGTKVHNLGSIYEPAPYTGELPEVPYFNDSNEDIDHRSMTVSARTQWSEGLSTVIGGKYNDYNYKYDLLGWRETPNESHVTEDLDRVNPYLGIVYDYDEDVTGYFSMTDIFTPNNGRRDKDNQPVDPVVGTNYEIGVKAEFFDDRLTSTFAVFTLDQDNIAENDLEHRLPSGNYAVYLVDDTRTEGFEVEFVGLVNDEWKINLGYSQFEMENHRDEKIRKDLPRKLLKFQSRYDMSNYIPGLNLGFSASWQDSYTTTIVTYQDFLDLMAGTSTRFGHDEQADSHTLYDLFVNYEAEENWSLSLAVTNLTDEQYYARYLYDKVNYGTPRGVRLRFNYNF